MLRRIRIAGPVVGLVLALVVTVATAPPSVADSKPRAPGTRQALEGSLQRLVDAGAPGAVGYRRGSGDGNAAAAGVVGLHGRPARAQDRYRIGSNTKTMTAVVVLQLVGEGRLGLDDRVVDRLPELRRLGLDPRITVRNLLQQTTGLHRNTMVLAPPRTFEGNRFRYFSPHELVRLALTNPEPPGTPGEHFEYSNTNYVLAGMLIERVTGHPVGYELRQRIFRPLGLRDTSFPRVSPYLFGPRLRGYLPQWAIDGSDDQHLVDTTAYSPSEWFTAGSVVSTARDETTFLRALFSGRLLPDRLLATMTKLGPSGTYAMGLFPVHVPCLPGGIAWGHNGAVFGYQSAVFSTPDGSRQVAVGINTWLLTDAGSLRPLVSRTAAAALCEPGEGEPVAGPPAVDPPLVR